MGVGVGVAGVVVGGEGGGGGLAETVFTGVVRGDDARAGSVEVELGASGWGDADAGDVVRGELVVGVDRRVVEAAAGRVTGDDSSRGPLGGSSGVGIDAEEP